MYLDRIIARKREQWANGALAGAAEARREPASSGRLRDALCGDHVAVIAEVKPRSPSKGELWPVERAVPLARTYASSGASAVSVLAEEEFFGGSPALVAAVAADPGVDVRQVALAHASGADGLLVIVRALDDAELRGVTQAAWECGLDPLHECFSERDLDRALSVGADLIGINNRDLQTFDVDLATGARLRALVPPGVVTVSESGLAGPADVDAIGRQGFDACLVGEALLTSADVASAVAGMSGIRRATRLVDPQHSGAA